MTLPLCQIDLSNKMQLQDETPVKDDSHQPYLNTTNNQSEINTQYYTLSNLEAKHSIPPSNAFAIAYHLLYIRLILTYYNY
jgi:hypothetical protein